MQGFLSMGIPIDDMYTYHQANLKEQKYFYFKLERICIMKKFKKILAMSIAVIMAVSMMSLNTFAIDNEIPEGLPEGAYKVQDGIYAVDNYDISKTRSFHENVNIGTVYPLGQITQPLNNFVVNSGHTWICIQSQNAYMRINFVRGNTSIFGSNYYSWPAIGTSSTTTYFIDADYYNFQKGVSYSMQCTSGNGNTYSNVTISIKSSASKSSWN